MTTHQNQSEPITCTFKVPDHLDCVVIELQGQKIRFSNILDPENAYLRTTSLTGREEGHVGDMIYTPLSVRQAKAALVHYYKNKVLPQIEHPDKDSDNFFWAWMLAALPNKLEGWDKEAWKRAFSNE
jgi:hypothetical protein